MPVLVGPTASGKTPVSLLIAAGLNAEIISADSRQIYKRLDIGTAKPSGEELSRVRHHFVDEMPPDRDFNAGEFGIRGREVVGEVFARHKIPLVVGGSGLYLQALVDGFFEGVPSDPETRSELYRRLREAGPEKLYGELKRVDPLSASRMLPSNTHRVMRALEVFMLTGTPISELHQVPVRIGFTPVFAGLRWNRKLLYARIDRRVDRMIERGLLDEVKGILEGGYSPRLNALQSPGYREVIAHLEGSISFSEMVELIKRNSRRYAKRQLTWFRKDQRIAWFDLSDEEDFPEVASRISGYYSEPSADAG